MGKKEAEKVRYLLGCLVEGSGGVEGGFTLGAVK